MPSPSPFFLFVMPFINPAIKTLKKKVFEQTREMATQGFSFLVV